jgi:hypothetical protein
MALFSGKRLVWQAFAVGVVASVSFAAQPAKAVDDLPVVGDVRVPGPPPMEEEGAPPPPRYYAPEPRAQRPYAPDVYERDSDAALPPVRVERGAPYPRPVLPPYQVVSVVRSSGYMPLGPVARRGWVYTMAAAGPRGIEGRLVIDARTGRIMRFVPALAVGDAMAYGPPPGPPLYQQDYRRAPRPPAPVPRVAKGSAAPKVASQTPPTAPAPAANPGGSSDASKTAATSADHPASAGPTAERSPAAAPAPLDKTAEAKPAATVGAVASPPPAAPATAPALKLWPTQALPPVQPLD